MTHETLTAERIEEGRALVRYCPGCGSIGDVPDKYRDCCPDGSGARMVARHIAESIQTLEAQTREQAERIAELEQDLADARSGWEAAASQLRGQDKQMAVLVERMRNGLHRNIVPEDGYDDGWQDACDFCADELSALRRAALTGEQP